jgi:hypothetical protein
METIRHVNPDIRYPYFIGNAYQSTDLIVDFRIHTGGHAVEKLVEAL